MLQSFLSGLCWVHCCGRNLIVWCILHVRPVTSAGEGTHSALFTWR